MPILVCDLSISHVAADCKVSMTKSNKEVCVPSVRSELCFSQITHTRRKHIVANAHELYQIIVFITVQGDGVSYGKSRLDNWTAISASNVVPPASKFTRMRFHSIPKCRRIGWLLSVAHEQLVH